MRSFFVPNNWRKIGIVALLLAGLITVPSYSAGAEANPEKKVARKSGNPTSISTGSGKDYKTTVDRKTEGELSAEDFRQASMLASRVVLHLNKAAVYLGDEQKEQARQELEQGVALIDVIHRLLPTTILTTVVYDNDGKEVYRGVDRVQEDRIPLHEGLVAVNTLEPITNAKQDDGGVQGIRLADATLVHTSVLVKLDYLESKLNRALKLLNDKPEDALTQLVLAQSRGLDFVLNKQDDPLVKAQMALQLAERMAEEGRTDAAKANLKLANNFLELYRGLAAPGDGEQITKLQEEMAKLQGDIGRKDAARSIRGYWDRVASWFVRKPGEMRANSNEENRKTATNSESAVDAAKTTDKSKK